MGRRRLLLLLFLCYTLVAVLRLIGPSDIDNRDQALQGLYVLDVVQRGSFLLPMAGNQLATKPPLYTWAAAAVSFVFGKVTDFTIKLPAVLSGLGVVGVTFLIGEMLFSKEVGFFAGLILLLGQHFADLTCIARTDMMLSFFISLSFYLFLLSYGQGRKKSTSNILMFVAMGLGSLTKGPVAFLLPIFVILIFLFFRHDLKWLRSMQFGLGIPICLLIILSWFIPALMIGGRDYFNLVVLDEMVNYFLGTGWARTRQIKPYFYLGHFFGKFLPWSLFVPSAMVRYWKSRRDEAKRHGLLFPIVWFLTLLVFFSISKGRRADYILPLYPVAAILVAQFWVSLIQREKPGGWGGHLRVITFSYLLLSFFMSVSLVLFLVRPDLAEPILRTFPDTSQTIELLYRSIKTHAHFFLLGVFPLAAASILGVGLALKGGLKNLFLVISVATALNSSLYSQMVSSEALRRSGEQKRIFCSRVAGRINSVEDLQFYHVESSIHFYLGRNLKPLNHEEVLQFLAKAAKPFLITNEEDYLALRRSTDVGFVVLEESEYLVREKTKYVLIGKKRKES